MASHTNAYHALDQGSALFVVYEQLAALALAVDELVQYVVAPAAQVGALPDVPAVTELVEQTMR